MSTEEPWHVLYGWIQKVIEIREGLAMMLTLMILGVGGSMVSIIFQSYNHCQKRVKMLKLVLVRLREEMEDRENEPDEEF